LRARRAHGGMLGERSAVGRRVRVAAAAVRTPALAGRVHRRCP
jgi:hypothetical protein